MLPALSGLIGRITKGKEFGIDFNALACAAGNVAGGVSMYAPAQFCEGFGTPGYVYAPWIARALAPAIDALGMDGVRLAYLALCLPAMLLLLWLGFAKPLGDLRWRERAPMLALLTGGALASGNISYVLHGLIALAALALPRGRILFILAVAAACVLKPLYGVFLALLLLEYRPIWRRLLTGAWAGVLCAGAGVGAMLIPDPELAGWRAMFDSAVMDKLEQAIGFFGWWAYFRLPDWPMAMYAGYVVFALAMIGAAFALAERAKLGVWERVAFGLGLGALLNPRLMDYDLLLIGLAPLAAVVAARRVNEAFGAEVWGAVLIGCGAALLFNVIDMTPLGMHLAPLIFSLVILYAGARVTLGRTQTAPAGA